jgi:hypothetical protein
LHYTCSIKRSTTQPGEDNRLFWTGILQHAENLDLKFFNRCAREYSFSYALESGPDFADGEVFTG